MFFFEKFSLLSRFLTAEPPYVANSVVKQKAKIITHHAQTDIVPDSEQILSAQLTELNINHHLYVLCACIFYIWDYNPSLLIDENQEI